VPWASAICYLGLMLDAKCLCTWHLNALANRATSVLCNIFSLVRDGVLTLTNKLTHYKLLIQSILTDAAPVWSPTCCSNYFRHLLIQSECLRVIGNNPRHTPTFHLHYTLYVDPIPIIIHQLTAKFFSHCSSHPNSLVQLIGSYSVADWTKHAQLIKLKQPKHIRSSAGKSLASHTSQCRRTKSIVLMERGVCSRAELLVFSAERKHVRRHA
jgi:hypothetical protein